MDFKLKTLTLDGKRLKLTVWDTAGQERFRTLTASYYRGAQGVVLVYDITRRETFEALRDVWLNEVQTYGTYKDAPLMLVGSKADLEGERQVQQDEAEAFARQIGALCLEASAKTNVNVQHCFEELVRKILETPSLVEAGRPGGVNVSGGGGAGGASTCCS